MKKLLMASATLALFAITICLVQISCQKAQARPLSPTVSTGTLLYSKPAISSITGIDTFYSALNLFVCNIDGSNARQIPISLPTGLYVSNFLNSNICLTANADSVVFAVGENANSGGSSIIGIYSCAIDGSGLKQIINSGTGLTFAAVCDVK